MGQRIMSGIPRTFLCCKQSLRYKETRTLNFSLSTEAYTTQPAALSRLNPVKISSLPKHAQKHASTPFHPRNKTLKDTYIHPTTTMVETRHRDYTSDPTSSTKARKKKTVKPAPKVSKKVPKAPPKNSAVKDSRVKKSKGSKSKAKSKP